MPSERRPGRHLPRSRPGLAGAALLWTAGLAPSLLPRPAGVAIALAGLLAAVGYGLGCSVSWVVRRILHRQVAAGVILAGRVLTGLLWVWACVMTVVATGWQAEQAAALGMSDPAPAAVGLLVGGLAVGWGLLLLGRGLRAIGAA